MKTGKTLVELAQTIQANAEAKRDFVAPTTKLSVEVVEDSVKLAVKDDLFDINSVAHGQIAEHCDIPKKYYDRVLAEEPRLLRDNVNTWLRRAAPNEKRLVRTLYGTNRAFLSDKYRPLDNEDLATAIFPVLAELQLDVMSCEVTERRLYIKAVDKKVSREVQKAGGWFGDGKHTIVRCLAPAITISNSEVGYGALSVLGGVYDSFCTNLATFGERSLRKYHTGARRSAAQIEGEEIYHLLSDDTRQKTDAATWAQVRDVVKIAFDAAQFDSLVNKIRETQEQKIEATQVEQIVEVTSKKFGFNEGEKKSVLAQLIEAGDLSRFGLYNAVTRAAQDVPSYDRATELERTGAQIIELPATEWRELAKAA